MGTTLPQSADEATGAHELGHRPPPRRRRQLAGAAVLVVTAGVVIAVTNPFAGGTRANGGVTGNAYPTSIARVRQGTLSAQVTGLGTLGYTAQPDGTPYWVVNQASGTFTALPGTGQVIREGQVIYRVSNSPVVLLNGSTPASRSLSAGDSGPDVRELNADLVAMGYAASSKLNPSASYFGPETASAVAQLQGKLGQNPTGTLGLGQAVFLPGPVRITQVSEILGTSASRGARLAQATSTTRQVEVNIDATQQSSLSVGDHVVITLPSYQDTPAVVASVGTIASGAGSSSPTIPVYITLDHPGDAGSLDQAPVRVQITTVGVSNALIVPVNALLAQTGGGYAVETVDAHGVHHLVPVSVGLFDDADGLVQVTSQGLAAGQRIVVPAT